MVKHENGGRTKALCVTRPDGAFVEGNSGSDGGGRGGGGGFYGGVYMVDEVVEQRQ